MRYLPTLISLSFLLGLPTQAVQGAPAILQAYQGKTAQKVGNTRLTWLIWDVYDASLFSPTGAYSPDKPFVLELTYLRSLDGSAVAEKTIEEMQRMGFTNQELMTQWQALLSQWFMGIKKGTRLAAMYHADGHTTFIKDGTQVLGTVADKRFAENFFAIWLGEKTLRPDLRRELLNRQKVAVR
jgi:hypothetical protein